MTNERGEYAIIKLEKLDKLRATMRLLANLEEGVNSAKEKEWLTVDDVEAILGGSTMIYNNISETIGGTPLEVIDMDEESAYENARNLGKYEGILVGMSSGESLVQLQ